MTDYDQIGISEALRSITSTLSKSEKALAKLKEGTSQHTMTVRGIKAYRIAIALINRELGIAGRCIYTQSELDAALEAINSAKSRAEQILPKLKQGTPQQTLVVRRIAAFNIAAELIRRGQCISGHT